MWSSRDVLIRTQAWEQAVAFYESVLGLAVKHRSETLVGFETGRLLPLRREGAGAWGGLRVSRA